MSNLITETLVRLRRDALLAALRNINLHVFKSRGTDKQVIEYVAIRLKVYPTDIQLWKKSDGVPRAYVSELLKVLNEHSVWAYHQLRPSQTIAAYHVGGER